MRKRRNTRFRRGYGLLECFALALMIVFVFVTLPVPVGTDAIGSDYEIIPFLEPTEQCQEMPVGEIAEIVPLVHTSTIPTETVVEEHTKAEMPMETASPKLYTDADAIALAKMGWGEALVTQSDTEIAATMWCALNRFDSGDPYYKDCKTIESIVKQRWAFAGYSASNPVDDHILWLAYDVLDRWTAEQHGETDVGRVLPPEYLFFHGDGRHNHFRVEYEHNGQYYDWSLESPYES